MKTETLESLAVADEKFRDARLYGRSRAIEAAIEAADAETARLRDERDFFAAQALAEGHPVLRIARYMHTTNRGTVREAIASGRRLYAVTETEGAGR